jgi:hypothetical protein
MAQRVAQPMDLLRIQGCRRAHAAAKTASVDCTATRRAGPLRQV